MKRPQWVDWLSRKPHTNPVEPQKQAAPIDVEEEIRKATEWLHVRKDAITGDTVYDNTWREILRKELLRKELKRVIGNTSAEGISEDAYTDIMDRMIRRAVTDLCNKDVRETFLNWQEVYSHNNIQKFNEALHSVLQSSIRAGLITKLLKDTKNPDPEANGASYYDTLIASIRNNPLFTNAMHKEEEAAQVKAAQDIVEEALQTSIAIHAKLQGNLSIDSLLAHKDADGITNIVQSHEEADLGGYVTKLRSSINQRMLQENRGGGAISSYRS